MTDTIPVGTRSDDSDGEYFRPGFHFTAARSWLNDPNGLVWFDGEYHLFFQCNPHGTDWGNMSWGHAVSTDLVHWQELPLALAHDEDELVFSGSVVVDRENTAGFGTGDVPVLVAVYTSCSRTTGRQAQSLAWSADRGRTWTKYAGNPVLDIGSSDFRDPKVFWYSRGGCWLMVVALAEERQVAFYRSGDLTTWEHLSTFGPANATGGVWECPDLFELPVDGDPTRTRWVLVVSVISGGVTGGSGAQYFVGHFDGSTFLAENVVVGGDDVTAYSWLDHGADYYAPVSFNDQPDGARVLIGWMNAWQYAERTPTRVFRGAMSLPRRHDLRTVDGRIRLCQSPMAGGALEEGAPAIGLAELTVPVGVHPLPDEAWGTMLRVRATFAVGEAERFGLLVRVGEGEQTAVGYDAVRGRLFVDRTRSGEAAFAPSFAAVHEAPLPRQDGRVSFSVWIDVASVEVFGGRGEVAITDQIFPRTSSRGLALFAEGGPARLVALEVAPLRP